MARATTRFTREHPSVKTCTNDYEDRPSLARPFARGREVCGREMSPAVTQTGTFWVCGHCDAVYQAPNARTT